jgi:hypothetical protein
MLAHRDMYRNFMTCDSLPAGHDHEDLYVQEDFLV